MNGQKATHLLDTWLDDVPRIDDKSQSMLKPLLQASLKVYTLWLELQLSSNGSVAMLCHAPACHPPPGSHLPRANRH